nr:immunoglobulin heavy chain junction region [Mus musculus]NSM04289.1 immunoglobulin heavy chain junction region [Mus musculus]NSM05087.1 immunoglobulin heavy chain junction region [Mus musculus]NSM06728.1 immunoglobulin heavy chain junction region [Mus musculus]NSM07325.1 immunoglobulin heavy chain junction region [Mus musculus]
CARKDYYDSRSYAMDYW